MLAEDNKDKGITGKAKKVVLTSVLDNQTITLDSLSLCVKHLKSLGYSTSNNTLVFRIKSEMEYNGFILKCVEDQTSTHSSPLYIGDLPRGVRVEELN